MDASVQRVHAGAAHALALVIDDCNVGGSVQIAFYRPGLVEMLFPLLSPAVVTVIVATPAGCKDEEEKCVLLAQRDADWRDTRPRAYQRFDASKFHVLSSSLFLARAVAR